jgi:hypothetical protein
MSARMTEILKEVLFCPLKNERNWWTASSLVWNLLIPGY